MLKSLVGNLTGREGGSSWANIQIQITYSWSVTPKAGRFADLTLFQRLSHCSRCSGDRAGSPARQPRWGARVHLPDFEIPRDSRSTSDPPLNTEPGAVSDRAVALTLTCRR